MNKETDILFYIVSASKECTFQLFKYDTVGDLKNEIEKYFEIPPDKQIIECWYKTPQSDANTLATCCLESEMNTLTVKSTDDTSEDNDSSNEAHSEISSIQNFKNYFLENFGNTHITFRVCHLEEAYNRAFLLSNKKQVLVLYLHNKNDAFATTFCGQLTKPEIQNFLKTCFLLCWDIEKDEYKTFLIEALHKYAELKHFDRYIESKTCAALIIVPAGPSAKILSILKNRILPGEFLRALRHAQESIPQTGNNAPGQTDSEEHNTHTFGSKNFQQLMLDMLGDRDYDSFDHYEFDYLKDKIAYSLYGPPQSENGYEDKQKEKVEFLLKVIVTQNNLVSQWRDRVVISFIYVCTEPLPKEKRKRAKKFPDYRPDCDFTPTPIFVLRKCKYSKNPCRIFIDDTGRVYQSWKDYLEENKLPECNMIFPRNGRYSANQNGEVILDKTLSPACEVTAAILQGADIASAVGGIASGGVMVAAAAIPAVAAAPLVVPLAGIAGVAAGVYSLGRSAHALFDRNKHKESLSFFESSAARGAYINIVAGSLGFVGAGANMAVSKLAAEGFNIGRGATAAVNAVNIANLGVGGVGVANASYDVIKNWVCENETPSMLTIVQLSSSILFFGHAVYNYKSVGTIIEESQASRLRDYQDSLRSNRHRKTFNKMLKETIRQNDGNIQRGQAEIISTIKNIQNKDEVFATLTRANKDMNRNNVRFAAQNGEITLNGVSVDMAKFSSMERNDVITFLTQLPGKPNPASPNVRTMSTYIENSFRGITTSEVAYLAMGLVQMFGSTDATIKEKIINAVAQLIEFLVSDSIARYMDELNRIFPNHEKYFRLFNMVTRFFQTIVDATEEMYQKWKKTQNPDYEEPYFVRLSFDSAKRAAEIFNYATQVYFVATNLSQYGLKKILEYFYTWFASQVYLYEERQYRRNLRRAHGVTQGREMLCNVCRGTCFVPQS